MMYATVQDVQKRMIRTLSEDEQNVCKNLLQDAAEIIDSFAPHADEEKKFIASCRMVVRTLGDGTDAGVPIGATQGSQAALGYSQSWTISNGANGELYLSKIEKRLLGIGNRIGAVNPIDCRPKGGCK